MVTSAPGVTSPEPPVIGRATREDLPAVYALLAAATLPPEGLDEHVGGLLVARDGGTVVGSAAVELHGRGALLRSVVVAPARRGERLGHRLTNAALDLAWARGVERVYLLTETASAFFARRGFREIQRAQVEPAVTRSREFHGVCPSAATVMVLERPRAPLGGLPHAARTLFNLGHSARTAEGSAALLAAARSQSGVC